MWCAIADPGCTRTCQLSPRSIYSVGSVGENPTFAVFWSSAFSDVANWQQPEKVEHGCTTTNLPLSNYINSVSVLQQLHCEIGRTISDVQKRDGQTDRQTNGQKGKRTQRFWPPRRRLKSELQQACYSDRGPRERSCTSKTFGGLMHSSAARGTENLRITINGQMKTPITP